MLKTFSMAAVVAAFATLVATAPASAAAGRVVVFETEFQELTVFAIRTAATNCRSPRTYWSTRKMTPCVFTVIRSA